MHNCLKPILQAVYIFPENRRHFGFICFKLNEVRRTKRIHKWRPTWVELAAKHEIEAF